MKQFCKSRPRNPFIKRFKADAQRLSTSFSLSMLWILLSDMSLWRKWNTTRLNSVCWRGTFYRYITFAHVLYYTQVLPVIFTLSVLLWHNFFFILSTMSTATLHWRSRYPFLLVSLNLFESMYISEQSASCLICILADKILKNRVWKYILTHL